MSVRLANPDQLEALREALKEVVVDFECMRCEATGTQCAPCDYSLKQKADFQSLCSCCEKCRERCTWGEF